MDNTLMNDGVFEALAFKLGNEEYGIKILQVQEIRGYESVTRIASAPEHVKGVVNLRGTIVPIVDMRIKFKLGEPTYNQFTVVIILNIQDRVVGMVVDSVSDVISLTADQIKPAPDMGALNTDYVVGLGTVDDRMLIHDGAAELLHVAGASLLLRVGAAAGLVLLGQCAGRGRCGKHGQYQEKFTHCLPSIWWRDSQPAWCIA